MKKKLLFGIIALCLLVTLITAASLSTISKEIPKEDLTKLQSVGADTFSVGAIKCNLDYCEPIKVTSSYSNTEIILKPYKEICVDENLNKSRCSVYEKVYYTTEELKAQLDSKVEDIKERILRRVTINQEKSTVTEKAHEKIIEYKESKVSEPIK